MPNFYTDSVIEGVHVNLYDFKIITIVHKDDKRALLSDKQYKKNRKISQNKRYSKISIRKI